MDAKIIIAVAVALVPFAAYVYAMRRYAHANWHDIAHPLQRPGQARGVPIAGE